MNAASTSSATLALEISIESALEQYLPLAGDTPFAGDLIAAMRYSALAGGKRIRPKLVLASCLALGADPHRGLPAACAIEYVHTYSLVHDDLPAMDNDDLRRGKPTCHKVFGEATAILAGNGLLTHALGLISTTDLYPPEIRLAMLAQLTDAAGHRGMLAGQCQDLLSEGQQIDQPTLETLHRNKTGALINTALNLGALASGQAMAEDFARLSRYGAPLGLAFQVIDDVLNVTGDPARLGKATGTDAALGKCTYVQLLGLQGAQTYARELTLQALDALSGYGSSADTLRSIASDLLLRDN